MQKTIYGNVVEKLLVIYSKYCLNVQKELPDHVSTEMEFASFLYFVSLDNEGDKFVSNHILKWVPKLAEDILLNAKGKIYKAYRNSVKKFMNSKKERVLTAKTKGKQ